MRRQRSSTMEPYLTTARKGLWYTTGSDYLKGDPRLVEAHNTRPHGSDQPSKVSRSTPLWITRSHRHPEEGRRQGFNELGRGRGNHGVSVFRDQEGAMGPPQRIVEQRYLPMTLTRTTPYEQTRRVYQPGEKRVAIRGKGKGKGLDLPEASHVPLYNGTRQQYLCSQ